MKTQISASTFMKRNLKLFSAVVGVNIDKKLNDKELIKCGDYFL